MKYLHKVCTSSLVLTVKKHGRWTFLVSRSWCRFRIIPIANNVNIIDERTTVPATSYACICYTCEHVKELCSSIPEDKAQSNEWNERFVHTPASILCTFIMNENTDVKHNARSNSQKTKHKAVRGMNVLYTLQLLYSVFLSLKRILMWSTITRSMELI